MEKSLFDMYSDRNLDLKDFIELMISEVDIVLSYAHEMDNSVNATEQDHKDYIINELFYGLNPSDYINKFKYMLTEMHRICSVLFYIDNEKISYNDTQLSKYSNINLNMLFSSYDTIMDSLDKITRIITITLNYKSLYSPEKYLIIQKSERKFDSFIVDWDKLLYRLSLTDLNSK